MAGRRRLHRWFALLALLVPWAIPAEAAAQAQIPRVRLFHSDSIEVGAPGLSPDGRWLAYARLEAPNRASLWLQPAAGGEPRRLTSSGHWDSAPLWLSNGAGIVFRSGRAARSGDPSTYAMLLPIDPKSGQPTGPARQITADPVGFAMQPSPDGKWLAYQYGNDQRKLRIVPIAGGAARDVTELPGTVGSIGWTPDGTALHLSTRYPGSGGAVVFRVAASGGEPTRVSTLGKEGYVLRPVFSPDGKHAAMGVNGPGPRERTIEVITLAGDVVHTIPANRNTRPSGGFTPDGRALLAVETNYVAPTRLVSIEGGKPRDLTPGNAYDWVATFSHDGKAVYTWTEAGEGAVLARVPLNGGARRDFLQTPRQDDVVSVNSAYVFRALATEGAATHTLVAVSLADDARHTITESLARLNPLVAGPGGAWIGGEEVLFLTRDGDRFEVHGWTAPGRARLIRAFPSGGRPRSLAVHGERIAWEQRRGDSVDVMVAEGPRGQPRRLLTHDALSLNGNELAFSHDGRMLALHTKGGDARRDLMAILDVTGRGEPRIIDSGLTYWYWPRWLPDNSGVAVIGGGVGSESNVVLLPLAAGAKPVNITRDDPSPKWGFELSPDGRWVAYPGEVREGGSTVWRIDLEGLGK